jgi:hypothetical protein
MPGVPRELAEYSLHVQLDAKPVKQPLWRFIEEKRKVIGEEIARLLVAGFVMEVFYPDWLENPVLVLKKNNAWRMYIDYTSLNKACLKDPFALPRIYQVIDSIASCDLLSFLDAYSGYHQIPLYEPDQIKTSLWPEERWCNLPANYAVVTAREDRAEHDAYMDDVMVKTKQSGTLLDDLKETFTNL